MISVDGDTSTNDTVLLLANGAAEMKRSVTAHGSTRRLKLLFIM